MDTRQNKIQLIVYPTFGVLVCMAIVYFIFKSLPVQEKTTLNFFALLGTITSLVGLVVTYIQVIKVKTTTNEINKAVLATKRSFDNLISFIDIANSVKLIEEIQTALRHDELNAAWLRMKDLKKNVTKLVSADNPNEIISKLTDHCANLNMDLINLSDHFSGKSLLAVNIIQSNLEHMSTSLIHLEEYFKKEIV